MRRPPAPASGRAGSARASVCAGSRENFATGEPV
jgi:hypothetical protein